MSGRSPAHAWNPKRLGSQPEVQLWASNSVQGRKRGHRARSRILQSWQRFEDHGLTPCIVPDKGHASNRERGMKCPLFPAGLLCQHALLPSGDTTSAWGGPRDLLRITEDSEPAPSARSAPPKAMVSLPDAVSMLSQGDLQVSTVKNHPAHSAS